MVLKNYRYGNKQHGSNTILPSRQEHYFYREIYLYFRCSEEIFLYINFSKIVSILS